MGTSAPRSGVTDGNGPPSELTTSSQSPSAPASVSVLATDGQWIEGSALQQLDVSARLDGMRRVVGFPDLHPGKGLAVGAAYVSEGIVYPTLAGNDIGCAMSFWATDLSLRKLKLDAWAKTLAGLDRPYEGDLTPWVERYGVDAPEHLVGLGTIGGGNHFAELQVIDAVADETLFRSLGLDRDRAFLLIHSGSRGLGQAIFRDVVERHGAHGLTVHSADGAAYLARHDGALRFASANRALIAHRFAQAIRADLVAVNDVPHNLITCERLDGRDVVVHRKGAATTHTPSVVIPGSRGTPSYLVVPQGDGVRNAASLAHGAGRRWQRGYAKGRLSHKYRPRDLARNAYGGYVICEDRTLLYDEAPQAYKDIDKVIADLVHFGLITVVAWLKPLLTFKTRRDDDA